MVNERTDEEIVRAVANGTVDDFGILVARYEGRILRYARKFLADNEDRKDLVQDVFLSAYEHIRAFDADRRFAPWLYRIAHNAFANELRRREKRAVPLDLFSADLFFPHLIAAETADRDVLAAEERAALERCLDLLDPKYREPIILHYYEEMDYRAIADVLHIPVSTVGVRIARGRKQLREHYQRLTGQYA